MKKREGKQEETMSENGNSLHLMGREKIGRKNLEPRLHIARAALCRSISGMELADRHGGTRYRTIVTSHDLSP
ncbi:hypothetical protein RRG08_052704 [Elysia crispata]|uniref:Uncharacterized protein n=1 Tax=Elysia crispata TaxID=231223 RepID=A0AAE1B506_9GAST|nr:hypothetical protein RRG08_052704 [Elysia crispata]